MEGAQTEVGRCVLFAPCCHKASGTQTDTGQNAPLAGTSLINHIVPYCVRVSSIARNYMDIPNYILIGFHFQGTLALIKPDAFQRRIEIEEIILKEGDQTQT